VLQSRDHLDHTSYKSVCPALYEYKSYIRVSATIQGTTGTKTCIVSLCELFESQSTSTGSLRGFELGLETKKKLKKKTKRHLQ
jgi:hypothetical protein